MQSFEIQALQKLWNNNIDYSWHKFTDAEVKWCKDMMAKAKEGTVDDAFLERLLKLILTPHLDRSKQEQSFYYDIGTCTRASGEIWDAWDMCLQPYKAPIIKRLQEEKKRTGEALFFLAVMEMLEQDDEGTRKSLALLKQGSEMDHIPCIITLAVWGNAVEKAALLARARDLEKKVGKGHQHPWAIDPGFLVKLGWI